MTGQGDVAGVAAVPVQHGRDLARAALPPGRSLAEFRARLRRDVYLGHGEQLLRLCYLLRISAWAV